MTRSSSAPLFTTPVLAPVAVLYASSVPASKYVARSNDLPQGWHCVLLNLWPDALNGENKSLVATKASLGQTCKPSAATASCCAPFAAVCMAG